MRTLIAGLCFAAALSAGGVYRPGEIWPDDRGLHIQAHGGGILKLGDTYYWFGEDRGKDNDRSKRFVACYSSQDLLHWTFRNQVIQLSDPENFGPTWVLERPKVFYNGKTKQFVMYMHIDGPAPGEQGGYKLARVGVAVSSTVDGEYKYLKSFRPLGHESRDIGQFIDDDGTPYLIFEDRPFGFRIATLSDDYLNVEKEVCLIPLHLEGGAVVHYQGLYYAIGSGLTGWDPNPNKYATAKSLAGPWSEFRDIAPPSTKTYRSQSTMLLKVTGTKGTSVIFLGDIWKPRTQWDSRYLWMPVEIGGGTLRLPEPKPWTLDLATGIATVLRNESTAWGAKWIAAQPDGATPDARMPVFRRAVEVARPLRRAEIDIAGLGQYELSVNGRKVGNAVLAPAWTNYRKTVAYNSYDVTALLQRGANEIGVMLGNGFFHVPKVPDRYTKLTVSFGQPKLIARLRLTYGDGSTSEIVTDEQWQWRAGPITFSHLYGGEDYDARLENGGEWRAAIAVRGPGGALEKQINPEIREHETFATVKVTGKVYDLGQNFAGWPRITVRGAAGTTVKIIPGELLGADGLVTQRSSGGPQWWTYTLKGSGEETWSPRFSYYGFRYLQIETTAEVRAVEGRFVYAAAPHAGEFACSKDLFTRIHNLIGAAIRSNMQHVLTDCPHREKLGWLEEAHLLASAVMYNFDVSALYRKLGRDMEEAQTADGLVPDIAPEYTVFERGFRDSPEWGSAAVLAPWHAYRHYGDREILERHFDMMNRYVAYLDQKSSRGILAYGLGDWYDIGPKPPGVSQLTSLGLTATAIYYADLTALHEIAKVIGKPAGGLATRAEVLRAAFQAQSFPGSQTTYAMQLALGLAAKERRTELLGKLVEDIRAHGNHTTAGDVGFHFVIQALSEGGRSDVIYDLLSNPKAPSYAAQLAGGATALTEAWDTNPNSSQNHFMLGHAEEWFYRYLAGIDVDWSRAAEEQITIRPTPVGDVTWAWANYRTPMGLVQSRWEVRDRKLVVEAVLPAKGRVLLPGKEALKVGAGKHRWVVRI